MSGRISKTSQQLFADVVNRRRKNRRHIQANAPQAGIGTREMLRIFITTDGARGEFSDPEHAAWSDPT